MSSPIYIEFPDAQVQDSTLWVNVNSIIVVVPGHEAKTCTLMLSPHLDAGIEVSLSAVDAVARINEGIRNVDSTGYYLPIDERMYNADAT